MTDLTHTTDLVLLNETAKANKLGIYSTNENEKKKSIRNIDWNIDATAYYEKLVSSRYAPTAQKPLVISAVIEHVRDGASFRCYIPADSCYVSFAFAGATCPRVNSPSSSTANNSGTAEKKVSEPEPFAVQSKLFTEFRLLNRKVDLVSDFIIL